MNSRERLRELLRTDRPLVMPDAFDGLSARLIELAGFKAVQCSGFSMALSSRAIPESQLGFEKNLEITQDIVQTVGIPVMADGEDGFGPPERVFHAVSAFIDAGVAGINIEDQVLPPCGGKAVLDRSEMIEKLRAARGAAARSGEADLVVNARTDVLGTRADRSECLREAIERGNDYLGAGADLIFVTGVDTLAEAAQLAKEIHGPVSIAAGLPTNIDAMSVNQLRDCGVARVSLPCVAVLAGLRAVKEVLTIVHRSGDFREIIENRLLCGMAEAVAAMAR